MPTRFEIVWQAASADAPIGLQSAADANEATVAYHEELARLRTQQTTGELVMRKGDRVRPPLLRQPLTDYDE